VQPTKRIQDPYRIATVTWIPQIEPAKRDT
jgi:hypothetical protein